MSVVTGSKATGGTPAFNRLTVTIAATLVFLVGTRIPLPGLDHKVVADAAEAGLTAERVSVMALGIMPFLNALLISEFIRLVIPPLGRWRDASPRVGKIWSHAVLVVALLFALLQAFGLTIAFTGFPGLVAEPTDGFQTTAIVTLVTGACLAIWLAHIIDGHGVGAGAWLVFLLPALAVLPTQLALTTALLDTGSLAPGALVITAIAALATLAIASTLLAQGANSTTDAVDRFIWPVMLGGVAAGWVWSAYYTWTADSDGLASGLTPLPMPLALVAALVAVFALLASARTGMRLPDRIPAALALAAAAILPSLANDAWGVPKFIDGPQLVILATVAYCAARTLSGRPAVTRPTQNRPPNTSPPNR